MVENLHCDTIKNNHIAVTLEYELSLLYLKPSWLPLNFCTTFQAALYFGVEMLLVQLNSWLSEVSLSEDPGLFQIQLEDMIHIWDFGLEHGKYLLCICRLLEINRDAYYVSHCISFDVNGVVSTLIDIF